MPGIVWDKVGERVYYSGVSKGAIYLQDGRFAPWNGLVSVSESGGKTPTPIYYDGSKVTDLAEYSEFNAEITAYTYPDELTELQGYGRLLAGAYVGEQNPEKFHLTYQTKIGTDVNQDAGYKIHIIYNVTITPTDATFASTSDDPSASEFSWSATSVPNEYDGFRPTSHIIIDSRYVPSELLSNIELTLYGGVTADPAFPSFEALMALLYDYYVIELVDNKDGTFEAIAKDPLDIVDNGDGTFTIYNVDATFDGPDAYFASSTKP